MKHPAITATLIVIALLFASLPIEPEGRPGLPLGWYLTVMIILLGVLLKWGPRISRAGYIGWAVMPSLAVFLTSLLNGGVGEGYQTIELWLIVLAVLVVSLAVSKSKPTAIPSARLRKVTLSATIVFGVSLKWASHISIGMMRGGDFWHLDAAYLGRVILPHPYDYYIIFVGVRMVVWSSLLCVVATAAIYFAMRNAEERRARRIAAPA